MRLLKWVLVSGLAAGWGMAVVGCEGDAVQYPEESGEMFRDDSKPVGDPSDTPYRPDNPQSVIVIPAEPAERGGARDLAPPPQPGNATERR